MIVPAGTVPQIAVKNETVVCDVAFFCRDTTCTVPYRTSTLLVQEVVPYSTWRVP
jgi:hypothetical protein